MLWALVPAKLSSTAKERLAPALSPELRMELARAMLSDVLAALGQVETMAGAAVISRDPETLELAASLGARLLVEQPCEGLNQAVAQGVKGCIGLGATAVLIAMGDIPLLSPDELRAVATRLPPRGVVLTPSADGTGTNLLVARPPDVMPTHFGPGSLALHRRAGAELGLEVVISEAPGAALDIDTLADLVRLSRFADRSTATHRALAAACQRGEWQIV